MDNVILSPFNKELEGLSLKLGFARTLFLGRDFALLEGKTAPDLLRQAQKSKKPLFYRAGSADMVRPVLEKMPARLIFGLESIFPKDSLHHLRGGLDQVQCKIAAEKGKIIAFSLHDLLHAQNQGRMLARMQFNLKLCRKYKVKTFLSTFAENKWELRSAKDLEALWRVLGGPGKEGWQLRW